MPGGDQNRLMQALERTGVPAAIRERYKRGATVGGTSAGAAVISAVCLTGEADSAMKNLKVAIELRPENRYHARNDEDFAFLQEDPRFTELLYPEKDGTGG